MQTRDPCGTSRASAVGTLGWAHRPARPCALLIVLTALWIVPPHDARGEGSVNQTKAEMLFNIARFVEWPDPGFGHRNRQIVFSILGDDELASVITATFSSRTINRKDVFVRFVRRVEDVKQTDILFIAASESARIPAVIEALRGKSVLTVADVEGFASQGGMVNFVQRGDKVRFEINPDSVLRSGLKVSAKVLTLAKLVAHAE